MSGCYNVIKDTPQPNSCNQGPTGDPYMIQMPPVEQWLTALPFLTDTSYPRDYVTIIRETGTQGRAGRIKKDYFTDLDAAEAALTASRDQHIQKGFQIVFMDGARHG